MPILEITSTQSPKDLASFTKRMGALFTELIGKPEGYCLVTFSKVDSFFFAGSDAPGFLCRVGSIGNIDNERNGKFTAVITAELEKELGVGANRGYILFTDLIPSTVGFQNTTFQNILGNTQS
ncbi:hypothetical protein G6F62_002719 [Rhizopus arrhizus]|nr:hypothetical protein G6F62_002719 [Rhizopus arrhizus]